MASGSRFVLPYQQAFDALGAVAPGCQLAFYITNTDTPATTYADQALTTPNTNPVVSNAAGLFGNIFLDPGVIYKVVLLTSGGDEIWTADPVTAFFDGARILAVASNYAVTAADVSTGQLELEVNAAGGSRTITVPIAIGDASSSAEVTVNKVDTSANPVLISDGANIIDIITTAATENGQINGWRRVYANGSTLRSRGVG